MAVISRLFSTQFTSRLAACCVVSLWRDEGITSNFLIWETKHGRWSTLLWFAKTSKAQYSLPTPTLAVCIEFATSWRQSRRVWTICLQRSQVASCRQCERTSRQSWPSFQFSASVTYRLQNCKLGHDNRRVCTHRRRDSTRRCVLGIRGQIRVVLSVRWKHGV